MTVGRPEVARWWQRPYSGYPPPVSESLVMLKSISSTPFARALALWFVSALIWLIALRNDPIPCPH